MLFGGRCRSVEEDLVYISTVGYAADQMIVKHFNDGNH